MLDTAETVLELAEKAAKMPPLGLFAVLILIGLLMLGVVVRYLSKRIEKLERAAQAAQKKADEASNKTEGFLREQLAERKEELADRKEELSKVVEALTNSNRIIEQNSRVLAECSVRLSIHSQPPLDEGDPRRPRPLVGL